MTTQARREREKEERRRSILRAAREVFLEGGNGFHRVTVEEVAARAEVSKGTVYLYFESKETILALLLLEGLDHLLARLAEAYAADEVLAADERLRRLGMAYFDFFARSPEYFRLLVAMDRGRFPEAVKPEIYRQVLSTSLDGLEWVARAIRQGMEEGLFRPCDARLAAGVLWATLNGTLELLEHPLRLEMLGGEREKLYRMALDTVIRGLAAGR